MRKRKLLQSKATKKTLIRKGDKRPTDSTRTCSVCGRQLTRLSLVTNQVQSIVTHTTLYIDNFMVVNICKEIGSCYSEYRKRGELDES
ncbi:hypothetical protein KQUDLBSD_CDS0050 [Staphylococcus phage PG-2021_40]